MWPFSSSGSRGFNPVADIPDLKGKVVVVTGGNSGLGFATIQHLIRHGAKVYMGARNEGKARDAIKRLEAALGDRDNIEGKGEVVWLELDLSDPRKAKKAAETFLEKEKRLDILINNAAITLAPYSKSQDDIQDIMMINYMSPFIFTRTLLPIMRETAQDPTADVRIVNVSSGSMRFVKSDIRYRNRDDFNDEHAGSFTPQFARYGRSKLANVLFTKELQKRFDADNVPILALSLHPGTINTEGNQNFAKSRSWPISSIFLWISNHFTPNASKGAYTQVFAAAAPAVRANTDQYKGAFLMPPGVIAKPSNAAALNEDLAVELWETTERLLEEIGV